MSEESVWSRLGNDMIIPSSVMAKVQEVELRLRDQILELTRMVMEQQGTIADLRSEVALLQGKMADVVRHDAGVVENVFSIMGRDEIYDILDKEDPLEVEMDREGVTVVESGFQAPLIEKVLEKMESIPEEVEPLGHTPTETSEGLVTDKESVEEEWWVDLDDEELATEIVVRMVEHIRANGAILSNHMKTWGIVPAEVKLSKKAKTTMKALIASDACEVNGHKLDQFRTLYYMGDDPDAEHEKAFGKKIS